MRRTILSALLVAALGAGCEPSRTVNIGALLATPGELDFGAVDVGLDRQLRVSITNPSRSAVGVPAIKVASDPNHELALSDLLSTDCKDAPRAVSQTLAPGECARFTVTWTPLGAHAALGSIEIDPSNSNNPIILPVTGLGLSTVFPSLRVCVLDEHGAVVDSACSDLSTHPPFIPTVDFGNGALHVSSSRTVRLFNKGESVLTFLSQPSLPVTTPLQFALSGSVPGSTLAPGASVDLALTATPDALGTMTGMLDLATDDPRQGLVEVPLTLATTGIAICVQPAVELPFGLTLIGSSPEKMFALSNCGTDDVAVASYSFAPIAPTTGQFTIASDAHLAVGTILHPNDQLGSSVAYKPTAVQSDLAGLNVRFSNSYGIYTARVGLSGSGVNTFCGTAMEPVPVANIAASYSASANGPFVAFDPNATPSPIVPLDYVVLSAANSTGGTNYTWSLVSQPSGSTTALTSNGVTAAMQTLVSGDYVVQLSAADASGCAGTSEVTIHVVPTGDVHIELTWKEDCGDVDLHYLPPGGALCAPWDTAYYNPHPDWGCLTENCGHEQDPGGYYPDQSRSDDPTLDHDDQWGFGPENVTQQNPFDSAMGTPYQIWVYYFSPVPDGGGGGNGHCSTTHPVINVYLGGVLANTFTLDSGLPPYAAWHAADLAISNQGATIQVIPGATSWSSGSACGGNNRGNRTGPMMDKDQFRSSHR